MTDTGEIVAVALAVVGAASVISATLRAALPQLRMLAYRTSWAADDAAIEWLGKALEVTAAVLEKIQPVLALLAMEPRRKEKP